MAITEETVPLTLIILDSTALWVRSLFASVPDGVNVVWFRPINLKVFVRNPLQTWGKLKWNTFGPRVKEKAFLYPGWSLLPSWSAKIASAQIRNTLRMYPGPAVVVYTLPFYAPVAARVPEAVSVYFAFDPYEYYAGWKAETVREGEDKLFRQCRAAFAISPALAEDFRSRTSIPVFVQPNGISENTLIPHPSRPNRPADLPLGRPVALCVGQMGPAYDWPMIDQLTDLLPNVQFVFVGPLFPVPSEIMTIVNRIKQKQNVTFLGWRDSSDLPGYVWNADVLFSPLSVTPANNRRSLLRMYDYLATDKPVVATPIESSAVHHPFVRLGSTAQDFSLLIQEAISGTARITNGIERRQYLEGHTWPRRMKLFLTHLAGVLPELAEVTNVSREFASSHCQTSDAKMVIASQPSCPRDRALD